MLRCLRRGLYQPVSYYSFCAWDDFPLQTDAVLATTFARNATAIIIFHDFDERCNLSDSGAGGEECAQQLERLIHESIMVRRAGELQEIAAEELVVGDIVLLSAGDRVPADIRLTKVSDLFISQVAITGESAILKTAIPSAMAVRKR